MRPKFRRRGYVEIFCGRYVLLVSGREATLGQLHIFGMNSRRRKIRAKYSRSILSVTLTFICTMHRRHSLPYRTK